MDAVGVVLVAGSSACAAASALLLMRGSLRPPRGVSGARDAVGEALRRLSDLPLMREVRRSEERSRRQASCLSDLPLLLDVLTLGLSSGLSFDSSLELYCERYDTELSRALEEAMLGWRMGAISREEALAGLADELDVAALRRFASVVSESISFGTPLAEALERQAQVIRDEQRSQVEEQIEKVPVKMLIPLGTLIVPAMFLAILGPLLGSALVFG